MKDARINPAYPIAEAARLLRVHPAKLQYWFPPNQRADKLNGYLNFLEVLQGYTIQVLRSRHNISMQKIRKTIKYMKQETGLDYPFATDNLGLQTDDAHLFFTKFGHLICASQQGQEAMEEILQVFLQRVDYGRDGLAQRFFPLTRDFRADSPKYIVVDPRLNFGRPCLFGRGIGTAIIASRYKAGESAMELADDYGCAPKLIDEAIRAELETSSLAA